MPQNINSNASSIEDQLFDQEKYDGQVQQIEVSIEQAKENISLLDTLRKLEQDPNFKKLILENYLEKESIRLVSALSSPALQAEEQQKLLHGDMLGIASLRSYFSKIIADGQMSKNAMPAYLSTEAEMLAEGK